MAKVSWDNPGERYFEAGVDRAVLYVKDKPGVPWNGLQSVTHSPVGGTTTAYFIDGINHLNEVLGEQFAGSIQAFTYPEEFEECNGVDADDSGISFSGQSRQPFNLTYRTLLGNDTQGTDYGYKIHLVYNATVTPTQEAYNTMSADVNPLSFSWPIVTSPVLIPPRKPTAKLSLNSTRTDPDILSELEEILYGTETSTPRMPSMHEIMTLFDASPSMELTQEIENGLWPLAFEGLPDVRGLIEYGFFTIDPESRYIPDPGSSEGYYSMRV